MNAENAGTHRHGTVGMAVALATLAACAGCRLTGTWRVSELSPPPRHAHLDTVSFARDGRYTATDIDDHDATTTTGRYRWNGLTLRLIVDDDGTRSYPCRLRWDLRSLRIANYDPNDPWRAVLRRSD